MDKELKKSEKIILLATFNPGKVKEYKELLKDLKSVWRKKKIRLVSLNDFGVKEKFEETAKTFEKNAILKAEFYAKLTGLTTLAEDGGLEIDVLKGEPGVKSRRWPGYAASDKELIKFTLKKLMGIPFKNRKAKLRAVIAFKIPGEKIITFEAEKRGFITTKPQGRLIKGFPYRSLFYLSSIERTYSQLSFKEEVKIGHRGKAVRKLITYLERKKIV